MTNLKHRKGKPLTSIPTAPMRAAKSVQDFKDEIYALMPEDSHWLVDELLEAETTYMRDDRDFYLSIDDTLCCHPQLRDISIIAPMIEPIMSNPEVNEDLKEAVTRAKDILECSIKVFLEDYPNGY